MIARLSGSFVSAFVFAAFLAPLDAGEAGRIKLSKLGKAATALLEIKPQYGSAFCIHPSGLFVTNEHVVRSVGEKGTVNLVLDPGLKTQRVLRGKVVRTDKDVDLAIVRVADAKDLPALPLGVEDELVELMELVAFGFPFGTDLAPEKGEYPAISVNVGNVTSLRRKAGELHQIQLDAALNPGNSGGPVLNMEGKVVGVVVAGIGGSGVNFAIPVNQLASFLARPDMELTVPPLTAANMHEPARFEARAVALLGTEAPLSVELVLQAGAEQERRFPMASAEGVFSVTAVPVPPRETPLPLRLAATFANGLVQGSVADQEFTIDGKPVKLSEVKQFRLQPRAEAVLADGRTLRGGVQGLADAGVRVGEEVLRLNLAQAVEAKIEPSASIDRITWTLVASQQGKEIGRLSDSAAIRGLAARRHPAGGASQGIVPPNLPQERVTVKLPAPIEDLAVGGSGRYLILHLPKLRQLAIFDVNAASVVQHISLADDQIKFAAGMDKLVVLLPELNFVQRWSLTTFEREVTAMLPIKDVVAAVGMGSASNGPLFLQTTGTARALLPAGQQLRFLDLQRLQPIEVGWTTPPMHMGFLQPSHIRASADGKVFGLFGRIPVSPPGMSAPFGFGSGAPMGLSSLVLVGNAIRLHHQNAATYHAVPGPDGKVLYTGIGLYGNDGKPLGVGESEQRAYLPAHHGDYYLGFDKTGKSASIYMTGESRPLATLDDLDVPFSVHPAPYESVSGWPEAGVGGGGMGRSTAPPGGFGGGRAPAPSFDYDRSLLTPDKRFHFVPSAKLLVMIPASNDQLLLRRVDVDEALEKSGIDYLFVTSQAPTAARKGTTLDYQLVVRSKKGGLTYKVESGPAGLRVSATGQVTWKVPADCAEVETDVIIVVRDASAQERFHTFTLAVQD